MKLIFDMFGRPRGSGGSLHAPQEGVKANESEDMTQERGTASLKPQTHGIQYIRSRPGEGQRDWITSR